MQIRRNLWVFIALVFVAPITLCAAMPKYTALYVFGDSYCDVGNLYLATAPNYPPDPPYFHGRFSNGPIWVDHIASVLGVPLGPSLTGGTDYAFGGAWVTAPQGGIPSVPQQVQSYLFAHGGKADPNALYFLEGGGNDIVKTTSTDPEALGYQIAAGLADSELMLRRAGARHFVIPNLFNVGLLPVASEIGRVQFAAAASAAVNKWLARLLKSEEMLPRIQIIRVDINSLMNAIMKDETHFNFKDVTNFCVTTTSLCSDPNNFFFWDDFHPTAFAHADFAVAIENTLATENTRAIEDEQ
jgi:phospholipase/lecithinase/hemolysin